MSQARQRFERFKLVAQAALVWSQAGREKIQRFIDTGDLGDGQPDVEPYDADVVKEILATGQGL